MASLRFSFSPARVRRRTRDTKMNLDQSHIQTATKRPAPSRTGTHLRGGWLVLARAAWVVMTLLILGLNIAALPHYDALLQAVCTVPAKCFNDQLTAADMQGLHASGSSIGVYEIGRASCRERV